MLIGRSLCVCCDDMNGATINSILKEGEVPNPNEEELNRSRLRILS